jgi:hypothetical protein
MRRAPHHTIKNWHRAALMSAHGANGKNERLYEPPPDDPAQPRADRCRR